MTAIAGGLISLEYAAAGLGYTNVGSVLAPDNTARDADLASYVQAATPVIEDIAGTCLTVSRSINYDGGTNLVLINERVQSITSVTENGASLTVDVDYFFDSISQALYRGVKPYPARFWAVGFANIVVNYVAGYATIPANVQLATRELVRFWIQQGLQANRPGFGDPAADSPFTPQGFAVPKRVIELLAPNRHLGGFA